MKLKTILVCFLFLFVAASGVLKYWEWSSLKELIEAYNLNTRVELSIIEEGDRLNKKYTDLASTIDNQGTKKPLAESLKEYDEIIGTIRAMANKNREYIETIEGNSNLYEELNKRRWLTMGKTKAFYSRFLDAITEYYRLEIESSHKDSLDIQLGEKLFENMRDSYLGLDHQSRLYKMSETELSKSFFDLSSLEKYPKDDFQFENHEEMNKRHPYGLEVLRRYDDFLGSYYQVVKDLVKGDVESAGYKSRRLQDATLGLSADWDRIVGETREEDIRRAEGILKSASSVLVEIDEYLANQIGIYPFLPRPRFTVRDLVYCQLLAFKTNLYQQIRSDNPPATNVEELVKSLGDLAPKFPEVDEATDKSVIELTDTDDEIVFGCMDREVDRKYIFSISKI